MKSLLFIFIFLSLPCLATEKVQLYLKWKHQFQFAGYYMALEKGYYQDEGLDVEIIERDIKWTTLNKVAQKDGRYGISDTSIMFEYLKGSPLIIISSIFQHSPLTLATRAEDNFLSPIELKGKKVMYQKNIDDAVFKVMFENSGIKESEITYVPHSMNNDDLISKKVDAISIYSTNQLYYYKKRGINIHLINPINYGVDLYGDTLFTSKKEADLYPKRVLAMRKATVKGWYDALSDIEGTAKLIKNKYSPQADLEKLIFEGHETKKVIRPDLLSIGSTNIGRLQRIANFYKQPQNDKKLRLDKIIFDNYIESKETLTPTLIRILIFISVLAGSGFLFFIYFNKKLKEKVRNKTKELDKLLEERDLFFSNMTHELRTPINGIVGSVYLLKDTQNEKQRKEYIDSITYSSDILLNIVNDILDFSKLVKNKMTLSLEAYNLEHVLSSAILSHKPAIENKKLVLHYDSNVDKDLRVQIDRIKLVQIINNLLSNAIKFTTEGNITVTCSTQKENDDIVLYFKVSDTGISVLEEELVTLFEAFRQANSKISNSYGGTGLGLPISKEIIELMNGKIKAYINPDSGMTFDFFIRVKESLVSTTKLINEDIKLLPNYHDINVLIAEDNKINQMILSRFLEKFNMRPDIASNGQEALTKLELGNYDIIFMDKMMPELDGIETTKRIRQHKKQSIANIYIIGQSANWSSGLDPECEIIGMDATISKPTKISDIKNVLSQYIKKKRT